MPGALTGDAAVVLRDGDRLVIPRDLGLVRVFGQVGIDMIAGPSEVLILADGEANPDWVAADLLAQAEHDAAAQSILITDSAALADAVEAAVDAGEPTKYKAWVKKFHTGSGGGL